MPETATLATSHLRLSLNLETCRQADGMSLLKQTGRGTYMAVTPEQMRVLQRFANGALVRDILESELSQGTGIDIRGFYDLIVFAVGNGFLEDPDASGTIPSPQPSCYRWPIGTRLPTAVILAGCAVTMAIVAVIRGMPTLPDTLSGWIVALLVVSLSLSLSSILSGLALAGYARCIYTPRLRLGLGIPHFSIDTRDAFMAGKSGETAVALQALVAPLVLMGVFADLSWIPGYFGALLATMVTACPFGSTPAHSLLYTTFRKTYQVPRCAASFVGKKFFRHLFGGSESSEDDYLMIFSAYSIFWFGSLIMLVSSLIRRQGHTIMNRLLFAPDLPTRVGASIVLLLLSVFLIAPLLYQLWFLVYNAYSLLAPHWFQAENRVLRFRLGSDEAPDRKQLVSFLRQTMLFGSLPENALEALAEAMSVIRVTAGTTIMREGDVGDSLFVLLDGQVDVNKDDAAGHSRTVATLGPGDVFGEIALLNNVRRTATVAARSSVLLLTMDKQTFDGTLVATLGAERVRALIQICAFLRRNRMFRNWDDRALQALAGKMSLVEFPDACSIISEGKPNDAFYIVYEGIVAVEKEGRAIARLEGNEFFGEISLLRGTPAVASVRALGQTRCLKLGRDDFRAFISQDMHTGIAIESTLENRMGGE